LLLLDTEIFKHFQITFIFWGWL